MECDYNRYMERQVYMIHKDNRYDEFVGVDMRHSREYREGDIIGEIENIYGRYYQSLICIEDTVVIFIPHRTYDRYVVRHTIDRLLYKYSVCEHAYKSTMRPAYSKFCDLYTNLSTHRTYSINTVLSTNNTYLIHDGEVYINAHNLHSHTYDDSHTLMNTRPYINPHQISSTTLHVFTKHMYTYMMNSDPSVPLQSSPGLNNTLNTELKSPKSHPLSIKSKYFDVNQLRVKSNKVCVFEMSTELFEMIIKDKIINSYFKNMSALRMKKYEEKVKRVMDVNFKLVHKDTLDVDAKKNETQDLNIPLLDESDLEIETDDIISRVPNKKKKHWRNVVADEGSKVEIIKEGMKQYLTDNSGVLNRIVKSVKVAGERNDKVSFEKTTKANMSQKSHNNRFRTTASVCEQVQDKDEPQSNRRVTRYSNRLDNTSFMIRGVKMKSFQLMMSQKTETGAMTQSKEHLSHGKATGISIQIPFSRPMTAISSHNIQRVTSSVYKKPKRKHDNHDFDGFSNDPNLHTKKPNGNQRSEIIKKFDNGLCTNHEYSQDTHLSRKFINQNINTHEIGITEPTKYVVSPKSNHFSVSQVIQPPSYRPMTAQTPRKKPMYSPSSRAHHQKTGTQFTDKNSFSMKSTPFQQKVFDSSSSGCLGEVVFSNKIGLGQRINQKINNKKLVERLLNIPRFETNKLDEYER